MNGKIQIVRIIPDIQVNDAADDFYRAAFILEGQENRSDVPRSLVNCAIVAIELYLKCLCADREYTDLPAEGPHVKRVNAKQVPGGHNLRKLLNRIEQEDAIYPVNVFADLKTALEAKFGQTLEDLFDEFEGVFQACRYTHELANQDRFAALDVEKLMKLATALKIHVEAIEPHGVATY